MLPLDKLSDIALQTLRKRDITEEDLVVAVRLDLDLCSEFSEMWLAIDNAATKLYRITPATDEVETFEFAHLVDPYVDNYMTTNRLLGYLYPESRPQKSDFENEDEYKEAMHKFREGGSETIILGNCTNTCKRKLFAFLTIWERLADGGEVKDNDPVFDQFNAKCPKCHRVYADQTRRVCKYCTNQRGTLARLLSYFKRYKLQLITVIICLVLSSVIALINPLLGGRYLYDQVITKASYKDDAGNLYIQQYKDGEAENPDGTVTPYVEGDLLLTDEDGYHSVYSGDRSDLVQQETGRHHNTRGLILGVAAIFGLAVLSLIISIVQNRCNAHMSTCVTCDMKNEIFSSMQHLSMSYYNKNPTGRLINAVNYDVAVIRNFYLGQIPALLVNLLNIIGLTILLFTINWKLTLLVFAPVIPILILFKIFLPKLWHSYTKNWRRSSAMNSMLGDTLSGVRVVKAFAQESEESSRFYKLTDRLYQAGLVINKYSIILWPVGTCITCLAFQAIWGFGGLEVMRTHMTYGQFNTFWGYIGMLYGPITFFSSFTNEMTNTINSAVRMFETLDTVPEICNAEEPVVLDKIEGEIKFDHVFFHYVPNRQILKDVCFEIKAGDHVGLVGHTGSGKSTVANLITRMYDVISGTITIDGVDVRNIDIPSLRKNVAIVSQEIHLFYGTIADNIRYAKPDATMDEIIDAARKANAHDFILRLPEGYETRIGAGERSLSGGERQRIAIARALLLKPSLLILDEATAAMDTETERLISDAIDKLIVGRTTLTIAHRLSTLHNCNCIMAIENGELAEMGTIDELLAKKGVYYKLYTLQNEQMTKVMQGL